MIELTGAQIPDREELQQLCSELQTELVIVGAIAYHYYFPDDERHTSDIDLAIALDREDFDELKQRRLATGWSNLPARQHRWVSQRRTLLDLIPAGKKLREAKSITWPQSQFEMSLIGFDHVFSFAYLSVVLRGLTLAFQSLVIGGVAFTLCVIGPLRPSFGTELDTMTKSYRKLIRNSELPVVAHRGHAFLSLLTVEML